MRQNERVIVTASDENYVWTCLNLLESLGKWSRIAYVIDLGLTAESRRALELRCAGVIDVPQNAWRATDVATSYSGAMTIRPQLPKVFPHKFIMWIDSDCWVQNRSAIATYFEAAQRNEENFVITAVLDAEYPHCVETFDVRQDQLRDLHSQLWDESVAEELNGKAVFNSGVFAASRHSPVWSAFEELAKMQYFGNARLKESVRLAHMAEQQSLHRVLHESRRFTVMTADFNWVCHAGPLVRRGFFVETPQLRRRPHIVHLTLLGDFKEKYRENFLLYESRRARLARFLRQRLRG